MTTQEAIVLLKEKYVFFDFDGTLCEYRYNNRVDGISTAEEFLFNSAYTDVRPLETMREIVAGLDSDKIFILGIVNNNGEINQKMDWLKKYYPNFRPENVILMSDKFTKSQVIEEYIKHFNINKSDVIFIDDKITILADAEAAGFKCYHITSFMP